MKITDAMVKAAHNAMHQALLARPHTPDVWDDALRSAIQAALDAAPVIELRIRDQRALDIAAL